MTYQLSPVHLRNLVRHAALSLLIRAKRREKTPRLRALHCHNVASDQTAQFERGIALLASMGEFVSSDKVIDVIKGAVPIRNRMFHISFDDGMKGVVLNAVPILKAYNVPATFFVATGLIAECETKAPPRASKTFHSEEPLATWKELEKAAADGLEIASHTRTHPRLSEISESRWALEDEIYGSKEDIERRFGKCRTIAWPFGRRSDVNDTALNVVKAAGYDACFGAFRGHIAPFKTDRFRVPRHHFAADWPIEHIHFFASGGIEPLQLWK